MPCEKDQEVEIRRLAKDTRAIEQRPSLFKGRSSQSTLPAAILQAFPPRLALIRDMRLVNRTALAVHPWPTTTVGHVAHRASSSRTVLSEDT